MSDDRMKDLIPALVRLGRLVDRAPVEWESRVRVFRDDALINRQHWSWWDAVTEDLSLADCIALAKAMTTCEVKFGWSGGSVAGAIWLQMIVTRRDPDAARMLADWQLAHTVNDWVPFGTMNGGSRSVVEFDAYQQRREALRARRQQEIAADRDAAMRRRAAAKQAAIERLRLQAVAAAARRAWLGVFQGMSATEQLRELADRADLHVNYFPRVFGSVRGSELRDLGLDGLKRLWGRLRDRREGHWQQLRAAVEAVLA